ncbi:reverse transcriptase [Phytophthora cinnamomi]|uniref:reverse transcriptase n=1 Tax=Phytophthora cinnamomi TaxID=4785 RepID=UPI00355A33E3|nr:reverse transcriptase [Phytophthora cinnamomi]
MVRLQPEPGGKLEKSRPAQTDRVSETESSGASDKERDVVSVGKDSTVESGEVVEDGRPDSEDPEIQLEPIKDSEESPDEGSSSDSDEFYDAISFDNEYLTEGLPESPRETEPQDRARSESSRISVRRLETEYERCMQMNAEELNLEPVVYIHEGSELLAQLRDELAMLPELQELSPKCDIEKAGVGEPGRTTPVEDKKLRTCLRYHHKIFLGDGNVEPAPARGVWCDLDVGEAKPVAQRPCSIAPHLAIKVYDLLKKLLETGLIEHSESPWVSPIVIVLKKNGVDIRMCIDYRVVNGFIRLSNYPLPLIDDLLIGFEGAMWFMSLDMASGFWAIRMTERS